MKIKVNCTYCKKVFEKPLNKYNYLKKKGHRIFCSRTCLSLSQRTGIIVNCDYCGLEFIKNPGNMKRSPLNFCTRSCSATFNNIHKTTGSRRSKLEFWLENKLTILYPELNILYCDKTTIGSELDIYIPSLKLAFELNGIYHYEPIHGQNKLNQIQSNDHRKFQACIEKNIELVLIDSSSLKYFKEQNCLKYLTIVQDILTIKLSRGKGSNPRLPLTKSGPLTN